MFVGCDVCLVLWQKYIQAMKQHIFVERLLKEAVRSGADIDIEELSVMVNDALMHRMEAGDLIHQHRVSEHRDMGK